MPKNAFAAGAAPGAPAAFYSERIMDSQENLRQKAKAKVQSAVLVLALAALAAAAAEYRRATAPSATASLVIEMPEDAVSAAKGENAAHKAKAAAENAGGVSPYQMNPLLNTTTVGGGVKFKIGDNASFGVSVHYNYNRYNPYQPAFRSGNGGGAEVRVGW